MLFRSPPTTLCLEFPRETGLILRCAGNVGNPFQTKQGNRPSCRKQEGRRRLRVPWTARRSNQSILKEINPEYSLEGLILKLKLQYIGHLMQRADSLEKTLMLGKTEGRRRGQERIRWLDGIINSVDMNLGKFWEMVRDRESRCAAVQVTKSQT